MLSKTLVVFFLVVYCVSDYAYGQQEQHFFRKDYTYIESLEAFYKINTVPKTWLEAKKQCSLEGAMLFYPNDEREAHAVISFWTSSQSFEWVYIGVSDLLAKGTFVTIDGIPISGVFHNWAPGEPNDAGGAEDCVAMKKAALLNDVPCNVKLSFICKKTLKSLQWNHDCNLPNLDYYVYNETLDRCYNLHKTPMTWIDAYTVCAAEQSYLSVVNSVAEAEYLIDLAKTAPTDHKGNYLTGAIHSGFHNRFNDGWQTVKGIPLEQCGYANWDDNQPDGETGEQCGSMFYNERLNDITCATKSLFICEHEVNRNNRGSFGASTPVY